jgi:perosamine synthetase
VKQFEKQFADYCNVKYASVVSNGTAALHLALLANDIKKGDEVIIPDFTMIATAFAVCYTGAIPVFVDVDEKTWNINANKIEKKITNKTKAIIPVHIFGLPCDMNAIRKIAKKYNLKIIEDCAESIGAEYKNKKTGFFSDAAAFSFFANKNITTGEGGMIITNSKKVYDKINYFKNMCYNQKGEHTYIHNDIGYNYRMTNMQAAVGLAQIEKADYYKNLRIKNGKLYRKFLKDVEGIFFQQENSDVTNVYWMNAAVIDSKKYGKTKNQLRKILKQNGIETRNLFAGMHKQPCLKKYGADCSEEYPVTEKLTANGFYLPSASNLKKSEIEFICNIIKSVN